MKKNIVLGRKYKKKGSLIIAMALMTSLFGCADNPDSAIIKDKDFDKMIEEATDGEDSVNLNEMEEYINDNYDSYAVSLSDDTLNIKVDVDAKVDIPSSEQMSIYRVMQNDISQDFLDKAINTFAPDMQLYDGSILNVKTKEYIEQEMNYLKEYIKEIENNSDYSKDDKGELISEYRRNLKEFEALYEDAPSSIEYKGNESEGKFVIVADKYLENPYDEYYAWQYELTDEDDEIYYAINNATDGNYVSIYVQNNTDYGNVIRYNKNSMGYAFTSSVYTNTSSSWETIEDDGESTIIMDEYEFGITDKESLTISLEDAKKEADKLLNNLGLIDFKCTDSGLYKDIPDLRYTNAVSYRPVYKFEYLRNIDGVFVNNNIGSKHTEEWNNGDYVKKTWSGESITVLVNDSGIVDFCYSSPITITETVVDKTQLKNFEEIKSIFEEMVLIANGTEDNYIQTNINIDKVVLRYTRISEEDNYDTGLLVPVWDFIGTIEEDGGEDYESSVSGEMSILMINAIDGSIIDPALGY